VTELGVEIDPAYSVNLRAITEPLLIPPAPDNLTWDVIAARQPRLIRDYQRHPWALPRLKESGVHELVIAPMVVGEAVIGVVALYLLDDDRHFGEHDRIAVDVVARQAGIAIHNARLFEAAHQRADELAALYRASGALLSVTDPARLAEEIAEAVVGEFRRLPAVHHPVVRAGPDRHGCAHRRGGLLAGRRGRCPLSQGRSRHSLRAGPAAPRRERRRRRA
jgi:GAF domain-containing protein